MITDQLVVNMIQKMGLSYEVDLCSALKSRYTIYHAPETKLHSPFNTPKCEISEYKVE